MFKYTENSVRPIIFLTLSIGKLNRQTQILSMSIASEIQKHISDGHSEEAIDLLLQATEGNKRLNRQAIIISSRYQKWNHEDLHIGAAPKDEINKIHLAVLDLLAKEEFKKLDSSGISTKKLKGNILKNLSPRLIYLILAILIGIGIIYFVGGIGEGEAGEFTFTAYVHGPDGPADLQEYGIVRLRLGAYRKTAKRLGEDGDIIFEGIPSIYRQDSVKLEFIEKGFELIKQDAYTPYQSNKITFIVRPKPMKVRGKVLFEGEPVIGAIVEIDQGLALDTTNSNGNFEIMLPKVSGTRSSVSITYKGKIRFSSLSETFSSQETILWNLDSE